MGEDSIDKALRRVQSVPWTFGMVGLATWLVVDLLRGGAAFDDPCNVKSRVTVTALMLLIAIGGWQLGRGIGGWYGAVVRSGTALMFAIKVTDIVVNSPFLDGGHSIGFARAAIDYGDALAWLALAVALTCRALRRGVARKSAMALLWITPFAKPIPPIAISVFHLDQNVDGVLRLVRIAFISVHVVLLLTTTRAVVAGQPREDRRDQWRRGTNAVFRVGVAQVVGCVASVVINLANLFAPHGLVDALQHLGISATNVFEVVTAWMLFELAVAACFDHDEAPRVRLAMAVFSLAWVAALLLDKILLMKWMMSGVSVVDQPAVRSAGAFINLLFVVSALGTLAWTSAIASIGRRYAASTHWIAVAVTVLVIGETLLRFVANLPSLQLNATTTLYIDMLLGCTWQILLAMLCFGVAKVMKRHAPPSMPAATAIATA